MSAIRTRIRIGRVARLIRGRHADEASLAADPAPADTPYRLLWSTGIVAVVLGFVAFVLWGINGAGTLFDMIVALCT